MLVCGGGRGGHSEGKGHVKIKKVTFKKDHEERLSQPNEDRKGGGEENDNHPMVRTATGGGKIH